MHDPWEPILPRQLGPWLRALRRAPNPVAWLHHERIYRAAFLCTVSASLLTLALYWGKARAARIDTEIGQTIQATRHARAQTFLLRAEWASLNDPSLLRPLAARYLNLRRIDPTQFAELSHLSDRLEHPPAAAAAPSDDVPTLGPDPGTIRVAAAPPPPRATPAGKPGLPHWLTEAHEIRPAPRATLAVHRYSVIAGQLPPLRPPIVAATPRFYMARTANNEASALGGRVSVPPPQPMEP